ncbi:hypothetical protein [Quadrisphaera granulorum]|nr:hypothetical protein [Quadrisphaera granulorum]
MPSARALFGVGVLALGLVLSGCGGSASASAPPEDASPPQVVRAYLDAIQAGDDDAAAAVSTPGYADSDPWQHGSDPRLRDVSVSADSTPYDTASSPPALQAWEQVRYVTVTLTVTGDGSGFSTDVPSGWGYVLVRHTDADPWRIAEAGVG